VDNLDQFKKTYFEECAELLDAAETHLSELVEGRGTEETLHAIFRAVHSIKGGAGAFGFARLVAFAHVLETVLDRLRDGRLAIAPEVTSLLLRANDALADIVRAAQSGTEVAADFGADIALALDELAAEPNGKAAAPAAAAIDAGTGEPGSYRIRFTPRTEMLQKANEPLLLIRELKRLGPLTVAVDATRLPDLPEMQAEDAYLAWTFEIETASGRAAIDEIFEFVVDDCDLAIEPLAPEAASRNGDAAAPDLGGVKAAVAGGAAAGTPPNASHSIRVDIDKVDRLVNLVGELVITQAMLAQQSGQLSVEQYPVLVQGLETLSQHARELQESVMAIRAQPVRSVFARIPRLVREIAAAVGKEARLVTTGEATEIDKTVIEQLGDPLTHMIRNALDHGIEGPEERLAKGKPRQGTIHLSAEHRSGRIVIEIADDGRGIDRPRVLRKAQEKGLLAANATLSDDEIDNLIFLPGFSTAETVSNISGRGVGMDVVKRNIQALGGRATIASTPGSGSRFTLSLPLTLAVLDGMIVGVGAQSYVVPVTNIIASLRPRPEDVHPVVGGGDVLATRGEYLPLVHLHRVFGVPDAVTDPSKGIVVMVESEGSGKIGLVVDELIGQQQVVVKSLEANYDPVDGIAAATILGSGRVALILDISGLRDVAVGKNSPRAPVAASPQLH